MNREQIAQLIYWEWIIWGAGILNVSAMLPQLWKLVRDKKTEGLSLGMFWIYLGVQVAFSLEGYFKRNDMLFYCIGASALVSVVCIVLIIHLRKQGL